jgi:hypothetical protein
VHSIEFDTDTERQLGRIAELEGKDADQIIKEAVLEHLHRLQSAGKAEAIAKRERALATLAKYRGRFKAGAFDREECYDRQALR